MNSPRSIRSRRAFTIIELLVVISLIVILILIAVPSFSAMVYSSEEAMAESQLRAALRAARDAAVRSNGAGDGAAVFFFEPGGRTSVLPCVKVGELSDGSTTSASDNNSIRREIFAAAPGFTAVLLPKYWNVRGFVPAHSTTSDWYGRGQTGTPPNSTVDIPNQNREWLFPETGFYNVDGPGAASDGVMRSTFMVRFRAGSGELVGASTSPALVLAPRPSSQGRTTLPYSQYRADQQSEDPVRFVRMVLGKGGDAQNITDKRKLIGRTSGDMVLARPVMQVALYNERKMGQSLGVQLDRFTDCVYSGPALDSNGYPDYSMYEPAYVSNAVTIDKISRYVEGDEDLSGTVDDEDRPNSRIYTIDRYSGALRQAEVQP
jgi:prepilin-type N-terminal cleavage/methylation domain-containing protein